MSKIYLGDSVYLKFENGAAVLTTENGLPSDPSNEIFLEDFVIQRFIEEIRRYEDRIQSQNNEN